MAKCFHFHTTLTYSPVSMCSDATTLQVSLGCRIRPMSMVFIGTSSSWEYTGRPKQEQSCDDYLCLIKSGCIRGHSTCNDKRKMTRSIGENRRRIWHIACHCQRPANCKCCDQFTRADDKNSEWRRSSLQSTRDVSSATSMILYVKLTWT